MRGFIGTVDVCGYLGVTDKYTAQSETSKLYETASPCLTRKSLVISKLSQLLAILGATFSKLGTIPL